MSAEIVPVSLPAHARLRSVKHKRLTHGGKTYATKPKGQNYQRRKSHEGQHASTHTLNGYSELSSVSFASLAFLPQEDGNDNYCRLTLYDVAGTLITKEHFDTKVTD